MPRSATVSFTGLCALLLASFAMAQQQDAEVSDAEPAALHVLTKPVKHTLKGPQPFEEPDLFGFHTLGFAVGTVGAIVAGYVVDNALARMGDEPDAGNLQEIDVDFDFRQALLDGIHGLASAGFRIAEIHEVDYGQSKQATARRLFKTTDADYAAYIEPTWFVSPGLDQVRLIVDVDLYSKRERSNGLREVYLRKYEYLSPSRGTLFRAFRPGEKEELIAEIESHFDQKSEQYPHNIKAYDKDRKRALKAIEKRSVIFPPMAMSEGWPEDSLAAELQVATNHVAALIRADLIQLNGGVPTSGELVEFAGLDQLGNAKQFEGYNVGARDRNTVYRDESGNVFSVP